jgi:hypothetical protein
MTASALALVAAVIVAAAPAAPRRVAVLDFVAGWSADCATGASPTPTQREQCELLRALADQARMGALAVLRPPAFVVMTRENTAQILKDMGGQCSEGECEVETARLIGASVVVSGDVMVLDGTYVVSMKVHDVASGALLGGGSTRARERLEAFDGVRAETERMLRGAAGMEGVAARVASGSALAQESLPPWFRRWWVEVRGAWTWPKSNYSFTPTEIGPAPLKGFEVAAGYRPGVDWSVSVQATGFPGNEATGLVAGQPVTGTVSVWRLAASVSWAPEANRFFSWAFVLGLGNEKVSIEFANGRDTQSLYTVMPGFEAWLDIPLGSSWFVGARAAGWTSTAFLRAQATDGGATASYEGKPLYLGASAAVGYRF